MAVEASCAELLKANPLGYVVQKATLWLKPAAFPVNRRLSWFIFMRVLWRGWRYLSGGSVTLRPPKQPPPLGSAVFRPPRQPAPSAESETTETASPEDVSFEMVDRCNHSAPLGPEYDGPQGYEPTRYGDWSKNGRVSDF